MLWALAAVLLAAAVSSLHGAGGSSAYGIGYYVTDLDAEVAQGGTAAREWCAMDATSTEWKLVTFSVSGDGAEFVGLSSTWGLLKKGHPQCTTLLFNVPRDAAPGEYGASIKVLDRAPSVPGATNFQTGALSRFVVTVAPSFAAPPDVTFEAAAPWGVIPGAGDLGQPAGPSHALPGVRDNAPAIFGIGTTEVAYSYTDGSGTRERSVQTVTVRDTTPPEIAAPGSHTVLLDRGTAWPGNGTFAIGPGDAANVTAWDAVDPAPALQSDLPPRLPLGTTDVTYTARDLFGNEQSTVVRYHVLWGGGPQDGGDAGQAGMPEGPQPPP